MKCAELHEHLACAPQFVCPSVLLPSLQSDEMQSDFCFLTELCIAILWVSLRSFVVCLFQSSANVFRSGTPKRFEYLKNKDNIVQRIIGLHSSRNGEGRDS
jgi:hypothetical protein